MTDEPRPEDLQHLQLLSAFHYVVGGLICLAACFPVFHLGMGIWMAVSKEAVGKADAPPAFVGVILAALSGAVIAAGWALGACVMLAGRYLTQHRKFMFCMVMAGLQAVLCVPFGTVLGVFTILVLQRPTVQALFADRRRGPLTVKSR